jgi:hypothetical protein
MRRLGSRSNDAVHGCNSKAHCVVTGITAQILHLPVVGRTAPGNTQAHLSGFARHWRVYNACHDIVSIQRATPLPGCKCGIPDKKADAAVLPLP